jgi:glycosyltransferase involved in cell wall biosynthesis
MKLSVIIPCYNEAKTIERVLERLVVADVLGFEREIIVVDDASQDDSSAVVDRFAQAYPATVRLLRQEKNMGKGAAIRRGFKVAAGDLVVIQDADLEYDPNDLRHMMSLFDLPDVNVVFGSRRLLKSNEVSGFAEYWGAQIINFFTNVLYGARITDQFTGYKMFRRELLEEISLHSNGFEIDAELTAKLLRTGERIQEVPITYHPRSRAQGKKIRWTDGVAWLWQIIKHRFTSPKQW